MITHLCPLSLTFLLQPTVVADDAFHFDTEYTSRTLTDSPAVPASAAMDELFRGFSYVAPLLTEEAGNGARTQQVDF